MANTILLKRSNTTGKVPVAANVALGELSINTTDGRLYTNRGGSTVVDLTQNDPITLSGDATGTSTNPAAGSGYSNLAVTLSTVNSNTGVWGGANGQIPVVTVNGKGLVTAAANVSVSSVAVTGITSSGTGNIAVTGTTGAVTVALTPTGPGAGTFGNASYIPVITTDAYGRVASMTNVAVAAQSTTFTIAGTTGTQAVAAGTTLSLAGTYGVTVAVGNEYANIATPQDLRSTAAPSFSGMTLNGNLTMQSGEIVATNLYVTGNLYAAGNTTTLNATTVSTNDLQYIAAANAGSSAAANGAGLVTPYSALTYNSTNTAWSSNVGIYATALYDNNNRVLTTASSLSNSGGDASVSGAYNTVVVTLNTVNSTPGTFGNATYVAGIAVNSKGLVTSATPALITPAWTSITGTPTTVAGYGITDALSASSTIDGGSF
jgi:hypothetical protein